MASTNALIVVDVQNGFLDPRMGPTNNPDCEENVRTLLQKWRSAGDLVVLVRHDSLGDSSPLRPGQPGNDFIDGVDGPHDLLVTKHVNSAFYGNPNLHEWLQSKGVTKVTVCGIMTNYCCETTARMAGNLGYEVDFALDATRTFDLPNPKGGVFKAQDVYEMTAANLNDEFATVLSTAQILAR